MEKSNNQARTQRTRRLVRRVTMGFGLALALGPTSPSSARDRLASSPRRSVTTPPWLEPGGVIPPPSPSGSTRVAAAGTAAHPALHGKRTGSVVPLFPRERRNDATRDRVERQAAMARHPAGTGDRKDTTVTVERGDSLWSLAEARVGAPRASECWPAMYGANKKTIGPNPHHIEPGQVLNVPKECR